jgi:hypothetical protein
VAIGLPWGAAIPYLFGRNDIANVLLMEGLLLAAAWGLGRAAGRPHTGALAAVLFVAAFYAGQEVVPWTGVEAEALPNVAPDIARAIRDVFDAGTGVSWRVAIAAVAMGAAAGTRWPGTWALLAGALVAGLDLGPYVAAVPAALAGDYVATRTQPRKALALALLPVAVVVSGPRLFGSDVVGDVHPEISVIR